MRSKLTGRRAFRLTPTRPPVQTPAADWFWAATGPSTSVNGEPGRRCVADGPSEAGGPAPGPLDGTRAFFALDRSDRTGVGFRGPVTQPAGGPGRHPAWVAGEGASVSQGSSAEVPYESVPRAAVLVLAP